MRYDVEVPSPPSRYNVSLKKALEAKCGKKFHLALTALLVTPWAVTKAGSRRRRGYNVDSSWIDVALSRWLAPHGRSAS